MALIPPVARRGFVVLLLIACGGFPAAAQQAEEGEGYRILDSIDAPRGQSSDAYAEATGQQKLQRDTVYATEIEGKLFTGRELPPDETENTSRQPSKPLFGNMNGAGVIVALLIIMGGLAAWLKFAGGGALLARAPKEGNAQAEGAPDGWAMSEQDAATSPTDLLTRLAQMSDRGAALVLLLRHSLLAAGAATQVRFARSDTERRAFARLPRDYVHGPQLSGILRTAELAHYGGRPVGEDEFANAIEAGRSILAKVQGDAHG